MWPACGIPVRPLVVALVVVATSASPGLTAGAIGEPADGSATATLAAELIDSRSVQTRSDSTGPYASRTRGPDGRWLLPDGDAVLIDEAWWTPLRPLADVVVASPPFDSATLKRIQREVAPGATPDRLLAMAMGDVTADGSVDLVVSFRRPFHQTAINVSRPRRAWVDAGGNSAHVGVYDPQDLDHTWIAGTLVAPVVALAACDGALAVAYGRQRRPGTVETGAWMWVVFGFIPTEPLPGPGTPICVDIDSDGRTEPAIIGRSEQ